MKTMKIPAIVAMFAALTACENPADGKTEAKVTDVAKDTAAQTETAKADAGNRIPFSADSKVSFVGSKVTGSHDGGFEKFTGWVETGKDGSVSKIHVEIDTTSVFTDTPKLTGHLKSADFFEVERFPKATFTATEISGTAPKFTVKGELELHGVKKAIEFPATINTTDGKVMAQSEFVINRKDFGIVYKGKPDDLIRDEVVIKFDVVAQK